eukprot:NODE_88_length_21789_cov_0.534440.p5 type:complete len:325 gc:universal NODE_88_length_21789_cov_0.534440:10943-9969(-)
MIAFVTSTFIENGDFKQMYIPPKQYIQMIKLVKSADISVEEKKLLMKGLYFSYTNIPFLLMYLELLPDEKSIKIWHFILLNFKKQDLTNILKFMQKFPKKLFYIFQCIKEPYFSLFNILLSKACQFSKFRDLVVKFAETKNNYRYHRLLCLIGHSKSNSRSYLDDAFSKKFYTRQIHMEHQFGAGSMEYLAKKPCIKYLTNTWNVFVENHSKFEPANYIEECLYICNTLFYMKYSETAKQYTANMSDKNKSNCKTAYSYNSDPPIFEMKEISILPNGFHLYVEMPQIDENIMLLKIKKFKSDIQSAKLTLEEKNELKELINLIN